MFRHRNRLILLSFASLFTFWLGGCAAPEKAPQQEAIFYPPPPDQPRLQFLTSFDNAEFWLERRSTFSDFVLGEQEETRGTIANPYGLAAYQGKLYICDLGRHMVHVINVPNRSYSVLQAPEQIQNPVNVTVDPSTGFKYICDTRRSKVFVFNAEDQFVKSLGDPQRTVPSDIGIDGDELFVADARDGEIEVWTKDGELIRTISRKGVGPDELRLPQNLDIGPKGQVYVTDTELQVVKEFDQKGNFIQIIGQPGDRPGNFARPKGIAVDPHGNIYVADAQWEVLQIFNGEGKLLLFFGEAGAGPDSLGMPAGLAIDKSSLQYFQKYVDQNVEPEYLLFVANQFAKQNKISVYAFLKPKQE